MAKQEIILYLCFTVLYVLLNKLIQIHFNTFYEIWKKNISFVSIVPFMDFYYL